MNSWRPWREKQDIIIFFRAFYKTLFFDQDTLKRKVLL
jgi:hypothetical protein